MAAEERCNGPRMLLSGFIEAVCSELCEYNEGACAHARDPVCDATKSIRENEIPRFVLLGTDEMGSYLIEVIQCFDGETMSYRIATTGDYPASESTIEDLTEEDALGLIQEMIWKSKDYEPGSIVWAYVGHNFTAAKLPAEPNLSICSCGASMMIRDLADTLL